MSTVPSKLPEQVAWYQTRETPWTTSATTIGISAPEMVTMSGYISDAADALAACNSARAASEAATVVLHEKCAIMHAYGADLIGKIKAKAGQVGGDSVYATAMIPPPATPTPVGDLNKPTDFTVTLEETGELNLAFKATQPKAASGVIYSIWRKIDAGAFECIGGCGSDKKFFDATVPAGSKSVTYKIQAQRSTSKSPWAQFVVQFGVEIGGGMTIASVVETPAGKIAA